MRPGGIVLVDRDCHKSHHYGMVLAGAQVVYLDSYPLNQHSMYGAVPLAEINDLDGFDGRHPNVFTPAEEPHSEFQSIEDINNHLLQHKDVVDLVNRRGGRPKFVFLMFDEETEKLAKELGAEVWFPKAKLRTRCDNKIETVRIGNKAGVPSVPNTLSEIRNYAHLRKVCDQAGIDHDLVLQSAFGDSGHTTSSSGRRPISAATSTRSSARARSR